MIFCVLWTAGGAERRGVRSRFQSANESCSSLSEHRRFQSAQRWRGSVHFSSSSGNCCINIYHHNSGWIFLTQVIEHTLELLFFILTLKSRLKNTTHNVTLTAVNLDSCRQFFRQVVIYLGRLVLRKPFNSHIIKQFGNSFIQTWTTVSFKDPTLILFLNILLLPAQTEVVIYCGKRCRRRQIFPAGSCRPPTAPSQGSECEPLSVSLGHSFIRFHSFGRDSVDPSGVSFQQPFCWFSCRDNADRKSDGRLINRLDLRSLWWIGLIFLSSLWHTTFLLNSLVLKSFPEFVMTYFLLCVFSLQLPPHIPPNLLFSCMFPRLPATDKSKYQKCRQNVLLLQEVGKVAYK